MSDPAPTPTAADRRWQQLRTMAEKVLAAAEDFDEAGGFRDVTTLGGPKSIGKALATLRAARASLDAAIRGLERRAGRHRGV